MDKKIHLLGQTRTVLACCAFFSLSLGAAHADLVLEYNFDEGAGTTAADTSGFGTAANGTLVGGATWSSDTPTGTGFSFDNPGVTNDRVTTAGSVSKLSGDEISIMTWFKLESTPSSGDRILSTSNGSNGFSFQIFAPTTGVIATDNYNIETYYNGATFAGRAPVNIDGWVFLATTYKKSTGESKFYLGSQTSDVVQIGSTTTIAAMTLGVGGQLTVGNTDLNLARTPDALFDTVRIYNEALDLPALEAIRSGTSIPEPMTSSVLLGLCAGAFVALRRGGNRSA